MTCWLSSPGPRPRLSRMTQNLQGDTAVTVPSLPSDTTSMKNPHTILARLLPDAMEQVGRGGQASCPEPEDVVQARELVAMFDSSSRPNTNPSSLLQQARRILDDWDKNSGSSLGGDTQELPAAWASGATMTGHTPQRRTTSALNRGQRRRRAFFASTPPHAKPTVCICPVRRGGNDGHWAATGGFGPPNG